jgi:hypothetical protein
MKSPTITATQDDRAIVALMFAPPLMQSFHRHWTPCSSADHFGLNYLILVQSGGGRRRNDPARPLKRLPSLI